MSQRLASGQCLALLETNLARDINVKEMNLSMGGDLFSCGVVDNAGVVNFVVGGVAFWDGTSDQVGLRFLCFSYTAKCQSRVISDLSS